MILEQYYLGCLAQASYLIGDETSGAAAVVDPRRDVEDYLAEAERRGLSIQHVILTHMHADFLAGHLELQARTGATIHLSAEASAEYPFEPLADGGRIELGQVRIEALATPGHTPEGISLLVYDLAVSEAEPHAVLTGDTLFIGDVGRPDLMASVGITAEELASQLYDSTRRLLDLPDGTILYPGHGAGSMCGKNLSSETVSTIGAQRKENYALQPMSREAFVEAITCGQGSPPEYFAYDARLNAQNRQTLDQALEHSLKPLTLEDFLAEQRKGAVILDARTAAEFAAGHLAGSINVGLDGKYATWAGTVLTPQTSILVVAAPGQERQATVRLGRIGFDRVLGYLEGGVPADRPDLVRVARLDSVGLQAALASDSPPTVLDVRSPGELERCALPDSVHIPLNQLQSRVAEVPRDGELVVLCGSGYRSMLAVSLLAREGIEASDLIGGMRAWQAAAPA